MRKGPLTLPYEKSLFYNLYCWSKVPIGQRTSELAECVESFLNYNVKIIKFLTFYAECFNKTLIKDVCSLNPTYPSIKSIASNLTIAHRDFMKSNN